MWFHIEHGTLAPLLTKRYDRVEALPSGSSETQLKHVFWTSDRGQGRHTHSQVHACTYTYMHTHIRTYEHTQSASFLCYIAIKYEVGIRSELHRLLWVGGDIWSIEVKGGKRTCCFLTFEQRPIIVSVQSSSPLLLTCNPTFHSELVIIASTKERALQIAPNWCLSSWRVENTFLRSDFL